MENNYSYLKLLVGDIAKNFSSTILYTTESYVSSFPAIEYRLDFEEKDQQIKGKIILNHSYLVSLQVFTHKQMALNKNMDYFLQSFHFKDSY
jgi:hypothetical protein